MTIVKRAYWAELDDATGEGETVFLSDLDVAPQNLLKTTENLCAWSLKRTSEFDEFVKLGYVPAKDWIKAGGWLTCSHCDRKVDEEAWDYEEDVPLNPVFCGRDVYCSPECQEDEKAKAKQRREYREEILKLFREKFPFCTPVVGRHFYSRLDSIVEFTFPGIRYRARWDASKPGYASISRADKAAWDAAEEAFLREHPERRRDDLLRDIQQSS